MDPDIAGSLGAASILVTLSLLLIAILWFVLPFAVFGTKDRIAIPPTDHPRRFRSTQVLKPMRIARPLSVIAALASFAPLADACHPILPAPGEMDRFEAIFLGEVTGIRLTGYENRELGRPDACIEQTEDEAQVCFNITSDPPLSIFALPRHVVRGEAEGVQELDQAGCNKEDIAVKARAIFFVNPGRHSAAIVWEGHPEYGNWLDRLGIKPDSD